MSIREGRRERLDRMVSYISGYMAENGWSPSLRDIAGHFGLGLDGTHKDLTELERMGRIVRGSGARMIRVVGDGREAPRTGDATGGCTRHLHSEWLGIGDRVSAREPGEPDVIDVVDGRTGGGCHVAVMRARCPTCRSAFDYVWRVPRFCPMCGKPLGE